MANPGAKPNPNPTVRAIVRHGLTPDDRIALVRGNQTILRALARAGYSAAVIGECVEYAKEIV